MKIYTVEKQQNYRLEYKYLGQTRYKCSGELSSLDVYMYMLLTQSHTYVTDIKLQVHKNLRYEDMSNSRIVKRWQKLKDMMPQLVA